MKKDWTYKTLGDICKVNSGKGIAAELISSVFSPSLVPCYGGNGIRGYVQTPSHNGVYPIIGRVGALCGNVHLAKGAFYATEHALIVAITDTRINPEWLSFLLRHKDLSKIAKGVAQPVISASEVMKQELFIPSPTEQKAIVCELDEINRLINLQEEQLREYDRLAQSLFYTTFGDPVSNPKGWEVKKIGEVATFINGKAHEQDIDESGSYVLINAKYISSDATIFKRTNRQNEPLYKDDIVMVMSDVPNGKAIAKCLLIMENDKYTLNQRICAFRDYEFHPLYLLFSLNRNQYYLNFDNGNSQTNLRKDDVLECPIMCPPLSLQQSFAAKIEAIEQQKALIRRSLDETRTLLASRMQYYFE